MLQNAKSWELLKVGDKASSEIKVTQEYINKFAEFSGDYNPIHIDPEYAEKTVFKKCIGHGLIALSEISKIVGTIMPGYGSVFLYESINYLNPIYVNDVVFTEVEIIEIKPQKRIIKIQVHSSNQENIEIISGELILKMM